MANHWDISKISEAGILPETLVSPIDGAEMVLVPEGEFTMGISREELHHIMMLDQRENPVFATETPSRSIHLSAYYIDRYPVTNYQYRKFIEQTGHRPPMLLNHTDWGQPLQPVVFVGWEDARQYARWANKFKPEHTQRRREFIACCADRIRPG